MWGGNRHHYGCLELIPSTSGQVFPLGGRGAGGGMFTLWSPLCPHHWLSSAPRLCGPPQAQAEGAWRACGREPGHGGWSLWCAPGHAVPRRGGHHTKASAMHFQEAAPTPAGRPSCVLSLCSDCTGTLPSRCGQTPRTSVDGPQNQRGLHTRMIGSASSSSVPSNAYYPART